MKNNFEALKELLETLINISSEAVKNVPEEYRKDAFIETYKHLLSIYVQPRVTPREAPSSETIIDKLSLPEFINKLKREPKANKEWITVFAYYIKYYENNNFFDKKEIVEYFKQTGRKIPANISRDLKDAVRHGYIAFDKETKKILHNQKRRGSCGRDVNWWSF
ncbi:MAG: hypothetical protein GSR84_02735 [Desulfurococcales archaeon]|nr:hypothetical protein [Desulfurococcales archaeon]